MSISEIFYRMRQLIKGYLEENFGHKVKLTEEEIVTKDILTGIDIRHIKTFPNNFNVFGKNFNFSKPFDINWQRDILSGEVFPPCFYKKINIRENPMLSAKCVWEINRLQFLTGICMNYRAKKRSNELELFIQIIRSWSVQNPFLIGVNWYSNIEINLRLITWVLCWEILDADKLMSEDISFKEFIDNEWLPLIKKHCIYSYENPSKYSSANNHLISECAGLFIASSKWKFKESETWIIYSMKGLENEIINQHSKDGVNKEEAAEYIQFITDFFLLSFIVAESTGRPFSNEYKHQLFEIFCYIYNMLDCAGNYPKYGDDDDGKCFILDFDEKFNNFKSLLTSGAIIFKNSVFKSKSNGFDLKNHFLFGDKGSIVYDSIPDIRKTEISRFYIQEGHFIFRKEEKGKEIYLHFDAAPLGFLSIAAHGHADALSFVLHIDGQPFFIDSGTYTYHTEPEWRRYFIGTLAHNTIRINQKDQAESGGPTLWINHYKTNILDLKSNSDIESITATHNGYLKEKAQHIREIVFDKLKNEFQIIDKIIVSNGRKADVEIPFHLHPEVEITQSAVNSFYITRNSGRAAEFSVDTNLNPVLIKGQMKPNILGWYSNSFLKKEETNVVYCRTEIDSTTTFKFIIKII